MAQEKEEGCVPVDEEGGYLYENWIAEHVVTLARWRYGDVSDEEKVK